MSEAPLLVCWGLGQDSSGMLVGLRDRGIKPRAVVFADTGSEREQTYALREQYDRWMFREFGIVSETVRYRPSDFKHWPPYFSLLENCLTNVTLPSLAYGYHTCSAKWKIAAINKWMAQQPWAIEWWKEGGKVLKAIGFDNSPHEQRRACKGTATFALSADEKDRYQLWFPLQEWGWSRHDCVKAAWQEGLPILPKSSCFFCPAMKPAEVDTLGVWELKVIIVLEERTRLRHLNGAQAKGWPKGVGVPLIGGLWRTAVKGCRGATKKPASMTEYIREQELLPGAEIDRIISATPSQLFTQSDFERLGYANWRAWLEAIIQTPTPEHLLLEATKGNNESQETISDIAG